MLIKKIILLQGFILFTINLYKYIYNVLFIFIKLILKLKLYYSLNLLCIQNY